MADYANRQNVNVVTVFDHRRVSSDSSSLNADFAFSRYPINPLFAPPRRVFLPHITALVMSSPGFPPSMAEMEEESSISLRQVN